MKEPQMNSDGHGFLGLSGERCGICERRRAALFMVIRDHVRAAKAHVCLICFELARERALATVEAVSLQDYKEVQETF